MRIGKSDNRNRRHRHSAQSSWSSGVRISAKICSNRHHGNWLNFDRNAVTVDALNLKMLLCQLNDFRVFGKLQFARWSLFNARPQQDVVVFDQKDFETSTLRFPLRIQRNLDLSELLAQRVANGNSIALKHGSGGAVENAENELSARRLLGRIPSPFLHL